MSAGRLDLTCEQGTTFKYYFKVLNPDASLAYLPTWSIRFNVRRRTRSADVVIDGSLSASGVNSMNDKYITLYPENATIFIELPDDVTRSLDVGVHVYDLELEHDGRPSVVRLVKGLFEVVA